MSYHILHLLSQSLRVRLKLDQLLISDAEGGTDRTVPLADVAVIVCAARDTEFSSSALRRMAELNVLLLVCNEKFEPCSVTLPYYRPTNTELLRRQIEWTTEWKRAMWRQIISIRLGKGVYASAEWELDWGDELCTRAPQEAHPPRTSPSPGRV